MFRYACWLCRDQYHAEDLVQETLLCAWRGFATLRDAHAAKSQLIITLASRALSTQTQEDLVDIDHSNISESLADSASVVPIDDALDIERQLKGLPSSYREVLALQMLFDYSTREMAALLATTEQAVADRLLGARRALLATESAVVIPLHRRSQ